MSVELVPAELGFQRPFTREVTQTLYLRNNNQVPVAFKVKTTAPKQYCVRPNSGRIEPWQEVEVQVLLQAMKEDPPAEAKCRDKFLVQTISITADREFTTVPAIWAHVEQTAKPQIQEKKIRVLWIPASGSLNTPVQNQINGNHLDAPSPENSSSFRSPSPEAFNTPSHNSLHPAPVGPVSVPASRSAGFKLFGNAVASVTNPAIKSDPLPDTPQPKSTSSTGTGTSVTSAIKTVKAAVSTTASSVASVTPTTTEEFKSQLADAKAQIARLTSQLQDQGLRQRKTEAITQDARERVTTGTTGMGVQTQTADGVPVQIVAGLCLLSFLVAYLFF